MPILDLDLKGLQSLILTLILFLHNEFKELVSNVCG